MSKDCEFLSGCGFFKKYDTSKVIVCKGFIRKYCKGEKQSDCKRKVYKKQHGTPPPDDMMPNGLMVDEK
ncbi:MAG TPA: hypothetical protein PK466_05410 [Thermotogota bacterium]|nr:hypothetical protein [Thermotogota bacterium]HPR95747.1 hypothetical protein [Thermotogota bacterium]